MLKFLVNCGLASLVFACAVPPAATAADGQPYRGAFELEIVSATNSADGPVQLIGTMKGHASSIGNFTGWVAYEINGPNFHGTAMKVAANGDEFYETMEGSFVGATTAAGTMEIDGGTGRFTNATGSGTFVAEFSSMTRAAVTFDAALSYDAADRTTVVPIDSSDFALIGEVIFTNIQASLGSPLADEVPVFYVGVGASRLTGANVQTGSIVRNTDPVFADGALHFNGSVGPHPLLGTRIHVISTAKGDIYCTWVADFTITPVAPGFVVFAGDGDFTVVGGTGQYRRATGSFQTLFSTGWTKFDANTARATVDQTGSISR